MQNSLIKRLIEKLKANHFDLAKKTASLTLAGTMAISSLGLAACKNKNNTTNPGTSTSQPNTSDNGNSSGGNTQKPDYSKYSPILQTVLTDSYYRGLIGTDLSSSSSTYAYNNPKYMSIPYGFLQDEGFDIKRIKNKELSTTAQAYSIDNDLYIELKTEVEHTTNYLATYVLKYSLTDQELKELKTLFRELNNDKTYYQAPFFIQELSYQKEPEIVSIAYITSESNKSATEYFDNKKFLSSTHHATYLGSTYYEDADYGYHMFQIRPQTSSAQHSSVIGTISIAIAGIRSFEDNGAIVLTSSVFEIGSVLTAENLQAFNNSKCSIISYTCSSHTFTDVCKNNNLEKIFRN